MCQIACNLLLLKFIVYRFNIEGAGILAVYTLTLTLLNVYATFSLDSLVLKYSALNKKLFVRALFCVIPIYFIITIFVSCVFTLFIDFASFVLPSITFGSLSLLLNNIGIRFAQGTHDKILYIICAVIFPAVTLSSFVLFTYLLNGQLLSQIYYLRAVSLMSGIVLITVILTFNTRYKSALIHMMDFFRTVTIKNWINKVKRNWVHASKIYVNSIIGVTFGQIDRIIVISFTSLSDLGVYSIIKTALSLPFSLIEAISQARSRYLITSTSTKLLAQIRSLTIWGALLGLATPFVIILYLAFTLGIGKFGDFNAIDIVYLLPCALIIATQGFNKSLSLISVRLNLYQKLWKNLTLIASLNPLIVIFLFAIDLDLLIFLGHAISQTLLTVVLYLKVFNSQNFRRIGVRK